MIMKMGLLLACADESIHKECPCKQRRHRSFIKSHPPLPGPQGVLARVCFLLSKILVQVLEHHELSLTPIGPDLVKKVLLNL